MSSARPDGSSAASSCAEPATVVLGADRDQDRRPDRGDLVARQGLARAADAGRERREVGFGLLGKEAERAPRGIANIRERGRLERIGDALGQPDAVDQTDAEPAQDGPAQARGVRRCEEPGDARAHGITHHVGAAEIEMIDERAHVIGHASAVIGGRIVELARGAVSAVVERDDATAGLGQRRDPAGMDPVHLRRRREAVHEHDRLALPFVEERDVDAVMPEALHAVVARHGRACHRKSGPSPTRLATLAIPAQTSTANEL